MEYKCKVCKDIGKVRIDREVFDEGFGRLDPCPECSPPEPEPEPAEDPNRNRMDIEWWQD